ncbi:MAG: shikimate kinase [Spirochaetota bacterium]
MTVNIAIIGPRGVGKSKISRRLSKLTGMPFLTTDLIAVYLNGGVSIPDFVKQQNGDWRPFRCLELKILQQLATANGIILDCGGGILFDVAESGEEFFSQEKLAALKKIANVVYLAKDTEYLIQKVKDDPTRPSLSELTSYREILARRLPCYEKAADIIFEVGDYTTKQSASLLARQLQLPVL